MLVHRAPATGARKDWAEMPQGAAAGEAGRRAASSAAAPQPHTASSAGFSRCSSTGSAPFDPGAARDTSRPLALAPPGASTMAVSSSATWRGWGWVSGMGGGGGWVFFLGGGQHAPTCRPHCKRVAAASSGGDGGCGSATGRPPMSPRRMALASAVSSSCCTTRLTGRAPKAGSYPRSAR